MRFWRRCAIVGAACALMPLPALDAQLFPQGAAGLDPPGWPRDWSPLRSAADLPRGTLGSALQPPSLLTSPPPVAGLFWNTGNPAALPDELVEQWSSLRLEHGQADGEYRRPLDAGNESRLRLSVEGWGSVHARSAAAGRVVLDRAAYGAPMAADVIPPYASSPLVVLDTGATELGSTTARIEGAIGIAVRRFGFGASLGFDGGDTRTVAAPVPRILRSAVPAAVVGTTWSPLGTDRLRIGLNGRWQRATRRLTVYSLAAPTRVYQLSGYGEPAPIDVTATFYRRDIDGTVRALGAGVSGRVAGARVVLFGELAGVEERHSSIEVNDPPTDTWAADVVRIGAAAQHSFIGNRLRVVGTAERAALRGRTTLADVDGAVAFTADERRLDLSLDARLDLGRWLIGVRAQGTHQSRLRVDSLVGAASEIRSWTTVASLEAARALGAGLSAAVAGAVGVYRAAGSIPAWDQLGDVYRTYAGPELALAGTDANAWLVAVTLRWEPGNRGAFLFVQARTLSASPTGIRRLPLAPYDVSRNEWSVQLGFAVDRAP